MVTKDNLRDKLYLRLVSIAEELSHQQVAVYISEILGDSTNALYKLLSFSSKESLLDYLVRCDFMTSEHAFKARLLRKYLLMKPKVQYHRPKLQGKKHHVLVLYTSERYSGLIQEQINWSRQAKLTLRSDDEWLKLLQVFDSKSSDTTNSGVPITQENPTEAPRTPERRSAAPPRMNNASSPPSANRMQLSTPILVRNLPPSLANNSPLDMHSTPTTTRTNGGGKRLRAPYTTPRDNKTKPLASSEKMSIQKSLDKSFVDRLSAMKITDGTFTPAKQVTIPPQQLFDGNDYLSSLSISSTFSETTRSTSPTTRSSQVSAGSFPASTSTFMSDHSTSSVNLGRSADCMIELINKDSYDRIKRKRNPPSAAGTQEGHDNQQREMNPRVGIG
jgi:hypothetical protein